MGFQCVLRGGASRDSVGLSGLQFPDSSPHSIKTVWGRGSTAPQGCFPVPPTLKLPQVCGEDTLTSQGMLRHTEAQGLQPVVDVRFSRRKLEFCRRKGTLITGTPGIKSKYSRCHVVPGQVSSVPSLGGHRGTLQGQHEVGPPLQSGRCGAHCRPRQLGAN